jgi:cation diffusion facilitator family transporter
MSGGDTTAGVDRSQVLARRLALVSTGLAAILAAAKITIGIHAGSTSVTSDGFESGGDALSSLIVYVGLLLAARPPDYEHPYGHGRYETLAGLTVGGMLLLAGAGILWHALTSMNERSELPFYALYPLFAAIVLKMGLSGAKFTLGRRIGSSALEADAWHDITDLISTAIALTCVAMTLRDPARFSTADHIGGVVIGLIVLFLAIRVVHRTVGYLLDTMPDRAKMSEIRRVALSVPGAIGIEKCYARRTGLKYHVDLHLEVDPEMTVRQSHDIAKQVRFAVIGALDWVADVLVHVEPAPVRQVVQGRTSRFRFRHGK